VAAVAAVVAFGAAMLQFVFAALRFVVVLVVVVVVLVVVVAPSLLQHASLLLLPLWLRQPIFLSRSSTKERKLIYFLNVEGVHNANDSLYDLYVITLSLL
jgi:hypothetical protein